MASSRHTSFIKSETGFPEFINQQASIIRKFIPPSTAILNFKQPLHLCLCSKYLPLAFSCLRYGVSGSTNASIEPLEDGGKAVTSRDAFSWPLDIHVASTYSHLPSSLKFTCPRYISTRSVLGQKEPASSKALRLEVYFILQRHCSDQIQTEPGLVEVEDPRDATHMWGIECLLAPISLVLFYIGNSSTPVCLSSGATYYYVTNISSN
ncbi:hypothetical protein DL96DRAFT_1553208 [Flagelloscypha sp. PMI_526]|nr:hypothetical protein DL96DRAFT_1553208 [Flagelloscypha sp. PMI_526]